MYFLYSLGGVNNGFSPYVKNYGVNLDFIVRSPEQCEPDVRLKTPKHDAIPGDDEN